MEDPNYLGIIVWCEGVMKGMQLIERSTDYPKLLQILAEITTKNLNQYSLSVSAKLPDHVTSQLLPITCTRDLKFFFLRFNTVDLFVTAEEICPPPSSQVPTEVMYSQYASFITGTSDIPNFTTQNASSREAEDGVGVVDLSEDSRLCEDSEPSGPDSDGSDEDRGVPVQQPLIPVNERIAPHPNLSRASFFNSSYVEVDMDTVDMPTGDFTYDGSEGVLMEGMIFADKKHLQEAVKHYTIRHAMREYHVTESSSKVWRVECKQNARGASNSSSAQLCNWFLRASLVKNKGFWKIKAVGPPHNCLINPTNRHHHNLDRNLIAGIVSPYVEVNPGYPAKCAQVLVKTTFNYEISYNMAWKAIKRSIENVYGTWESSCAYLPKFMRAMTKYNPGTVVEWQHVENYPIRGAYTLGFVFWSFKPVIDAWHQCRPVISVDGTHLYTKYKHKLLIAIGLDANQKILPLAYAIVDEESEASWRWFLECVVFHIIRGREGVCFISDRHAGILKAVCRMDYFRASRGVHRFCLRHLAANLKKNFKSVELKDLCHAAGKAPTVAKWEKIMGQIQELCIGAWKYLAAIDRDKWTHCYDGGYRYGVMTTNISECCNGVLVGARRLPITALVKITYSRSVEAFHNRELDAVRVQQAKQMWPDSILKKWNNASKLGLSLQYGIQEYSSTTHTASVTSYNPGSKRPITHRVKLSTRECSCGSWTQGSVPCSHVMAVCRRFEYDPTQFVHPCFSTQAYITTYTTTRFEPLADEEYWDEPTFILRHNPARQIKRRGRAVTTRIHNEMDWPETRARQHYQAHNVARGSGSTSHHG